MESQNYDVNSIVMNVMDTADSIAIDSNPGNGSSSSDNQNSTNVGHAVENASLEEMEDVQMQNFDTSGDGRIKIEIKILT